MKQLSIAFAVTALLTGASIAQVFGNCSRYVKASSPSSTAGCACDGQPVIGGTVDLWFPAVTISMPPPVPSHVLLFGVEDPGFSVSWGRGTIQGWRPAHQLAIRLLSTNHCNIPLHTCEIDAVYGTTLTIPSDPNLVGTRWRAGVVQVFDPTGVAVFPSHDPTLDVSLVIGAP